MRVKVWIFLVSKQSLRYNSYPPDDNKRPKESKESFDGYEKSMYFVLITGRYSNRFLYL